jgi:hypothetical protein
LIVAPVRFTVFEQVAWLASIYSRSLPPDPSID